MSDSIETNSAVCAILYKAIRDSETKFSFADYNMVQKMLSFYKDSCLEAKKDMNSLIVDINAAQDVLQEFKESDYTISEVKNIAKDNIDPSNVKMVEDMLKDEKTF